MRGDPARSRIKRAAGIFAAEGRERVLLRAGVGKDKALYLAALKNTIPMYSETGLMDPKGADAVLAVFSEGSPEVAKANIDVSKTFTNSFVEQARKTTGLSAK